MYAICPLMIVPIREFASHKSEQISQMLYGEVCFVIKTEQNWSYIRTDFDDYEGWVDTKQLVVISSKVYKEIKNTLPRYAIDFVDLVQHSVNKDFIQSICIGATVSNAPFLGQVFLGEIQQGVSKQSIGEIAHRYLNAPYLWGGKTPFGIDCSGLVQMVYKLVGIALPRDAYQQAQVGQEVRLEDAQMGDLAFFSDENGKIIHTGILLTNKMIIHSHGKVRIDTLYSEGIYNEEYKKYTHRLSFIKRILP